MGKVTAKSMSPRHVKAARALLGYSAEEFADLLPIGLATLRNFESGKDIKPASRAAIFDTLYDHGVRMQNGGSPGVRITEPEKWAINIKRTPCPICDTLQPLIRTPANVRQAIWGGWACENCGTEISKTGRELYKAD